MHHGINKKLKRGQQKLIHLIHTAVSFEYPPHTHHDTHIVMLRCRYRPKREIADWQWWRLSIVDPFDSDHDLGIAVRMMGTQKRITHELRRARQIVESSTVVDR